MPDKETKKIIKKLDKTVNSVESTANALYNTMLKAREELRKPEPPAPEDVLKGWNIDISDADFSATLRVNAIRIVQWYVQLEWAPPTDPLFEEKWRRHYTEQSRLYGLAQTLLFSAKKQKVDMDYAGQHLTDFIGLCNGNVNFMRFCEAERNSALGGRHADAGPSEVESLI